MQYFAGIERNLEPDLYDTHYREYHTTQGRWLTPDPAGLAAVDPSNPQTWNRYAYVANNPLSNTDPLGLYCFINCDGGGPPGGIGASCDVTGEFCFPILIPRGGAGGGDDGGGGPPVGSSGGGPSSGGNHGPWPGNETTGLPQLPTQPLSIGDILGLNPNGPCDFGVCNPIGNDFVSGISGAGTPGSPFTINVLVLASILNDLTQNGSIATTSCDAYRKGRRPDLYGLCQYVFGNGPRLNFIRGCLQANFDPKTGRYNDSSPLGVLVFGPLYPIVFGGSGTFTHAYCIPRGIVYGD
jgi:RHS repeat-associated protein